MPVQMPGDDSRWRCALCGNLTRFDLVRVRRTHDFIHVSLSGDQQVDETHVLEEQVLDVRCRWCGSDRIDVVPRPA